MAANKFAAMLQRNTNKVTVILVYAVLEWFLIILLLLNSLFSYLITKFAKFFGLKPPCPLCSWIDHALERGKNTHSYRELFCENHAGEISKLGYCLNHGKLNETQTMCEDCLASRPHHYDGSIGMRQNLAFISWVSNSDCKVENGEDALRCSCCNGSLTNKLFPPYILLKPSRGTANYVRKGDLIVETIDDEKDGDDNEHEPEKINNEDHEDAGFVDEHHILSDIESFILREAAEDRSSSVSNLQCDEKDVEKDDNDDVLTITANDTNIHDWLEEDSSLQVIKLNSGEKVTCDTNRVVAVEVIDRFTLASPESCISEEDLTEKTGSFDSAKVNEGKLQGFEIGINGVDSSSLSNVEEEKQESIFEACHHSLTTERVQNLPDEDISNGMIQTKPDKIQSDDQFRMQESAASDTEEDQSSSSDDDAAAEISNAFDEFMSQNNLCIHASESDTIPEIKNIQIEKHHEEVGHQLCRAEVYEAEEDKIPDTPSSIDGLQYLHKKLLLYEKRESGVEDSLDGSVKMSEMEGGDLGLTIERLKASLKAERKALSALYRELEEERSASAIAANQTMAMITRLQEEKAAMQMEASQYQRMMEEQSEYDQEALQLLNELMVKREKEKEELEKELEVYRQKVIEYETIEKIRALRRMKNQRDRSSRDSSPLCSDHGDSDEISIDLNRQTREVDSDNHLHQEKCENNESIDTTLNLEEMAEACVRHISTLDDSLAEFEEERLSILDQLKALEQKIISIGGDEEFIEEIKQIEQSSSYCAVDINENNGPEEIGFIDDKEVPIRKTMGSLAKRLLPLLDAADNEIKYESTNEENAESDCLEMQHLAMRKFDAEIEGRNLSLEEEVDHVYERLQALEADREFLKHCMSSVNMGDNGMNILQEILQHLRDLREAELRFKIMNSGMLQ